MKKTENKQSEPIRVFIVDDHVLVRRGIVATLGSQPEVGICGESNSTSAIGKIKKAKASVALVDVSFRGASVLELIKQIVAMENGPRVLAFDMGGETMYATRAIKLGAKGYLAGDNIETHLVDAIKRIDAGSLYVTDEMAQQMVATLTQTRVAGDVEPIQMLSNRELEMAELIGQGKTNTYIAESMGISIKTVETHKAHMKKKLGLQKGIELVRFCVQWWENRNNGDGHEYSHA